MMRRGRPGLMGTVARTAVVAGTATAVSRGVSNKMDSKQQAAQAEAQQEQAQQDQIAQQQQQIDQLQQQQAAAPAAPADDDDVVAQLQKLADLKSAGVLSDEEFAAAKAKLLGT